MRAVLEVMQFEIRYQLRSPFFLGALLMYALVHFLAITGTGIHIDISNQVAINSTYAILQIELVLFIFGILPILAFVTTAITRDYEFETASLLFVTPVSSQNFVLGRFLGALIPAILIGLAGLLGSMIGTFMPWLDQTRIVTFSLLPWTYIFLVVILPGTLVLCAIFFSIAALTRSFALTYGAAMAFFVAVLTLMTLQGLSGYTHFEPGLYLQSAFVHNGIYFCMLCIPAVVIQAISSNKWLGMLLTLGVYIALLCLPAMGFDHMLYNFSIRAAYSDMNGFGYFIKPVFSQIGYWGAFCVLLLIVGHLLYPRCYYFSLRERLRDAGTRLGGEVRIAACLAAIAFITIGGWIFYNTNILNEYSFQTSPCPTSRDLVQALRAGAGPEYQQLITDLFERIVLYDLQVDAAGVREIAGEYEVTVEVTAKQFEDDGHGKETGEPLDSWFDVAVFPETDEPLERVTPLYLEKHRLHSGKQTLTVRTSKKPGIVALDPFHKRIERSAGNNSRTIDLLHHLRNRPG